MISPVAPVDRPVDGWVEGLNILLMEEIRQQFIRSLPYYVQDFIHPAWCRISSINRITWFGRNLGEKLTSNPAPKWQHYKLYWNPLFFFASGFLWPTLSGFPQVICASSSLRITGGIEHI